MGINWLQVLYPLNSAIQESSLQEIKDNVILYHFAENFNGDKIIWMFRWQDLFTRKCVVCHFLSFLKLEESL